MDEILISLAAAMVSLLMGGAASSIFEKLARRLRKAPVLEAVPYAVRLASLTESLTKSTRQVDAVLAELAHVAKEREAAVAALEGSLQELEVREKTLKQQIETLQSVPIPAVDHFARLLESGGKRSARRDYILFGAGVVVSTTIAVVLNLIGLA